MMPSEITSAAVDQALTFLGFEDPGAIMEMRYDGGTLAVVRVVRDADGNDVTRGGSAVYEQSNYVLED